MNYPIKYKRICAFLLAFLVTAVLFLSALFIVTHAKHDCTGEGCPICREIKACAAMIRLITEAVEIGAAVIVIYVILQKLRVSYPAGTNLRQASLVSLKVRLDN